MSRLNFIRDKFELEFDFQLRKFRELPKLKPIKSVKKPIFSVINTGKGTPYLQG